MFRRAATIALTALLSACAGGAEPAASRGSVPAVNAATTELLPHEADALPRFELADFERLGAALHGTPVVVNIWASWCGPCVSESPELASALDTFGRDVQFLGIDVLDDRGDAAAFIRDHHITYPSVFDEDGDIRDALGFVGQPDTIFYDANGRVVSTWTGPITRNVLRDRIEAILDAPPPSYSFVTPSGTSSCGCTMSYSLTCHTWLSVAVSTLNPKS